jgi:hypothetical protein
VPCLLRAQQSPALAPGEFACSEGAAIHIARGDLYAVQSRSTAVAQATRRVNRYNDYRVLQTTTS